MTARLVTLAGVVVAALVALTAGSCSDGRGSEAEKIVAQASEAMASRSFSVTTCLSCDPPTTMDYAPPDRIALSHSDGHDAWEFNLIVGDRRYHSSRGERWLEGVALEHIFMPLGDPRVLLRYAGEPALEKEETLNGLEHYVIAAGVNHAQLAVEFWREPAALLGVDDEQALNDFEDLISGLRVRFWINQDTFVVSQMEVDYPPFPPGEDEPSGDSIEDPPPVVVSFDFDAIVEVPTDPVSLPAEEVGRLNDELKELFKVIRRALAAYEEELGANPPRADQHVLSDFLDAPWPINPYTDELMVQSVAYSPGDFCYEPGPPGERYRFGMYGWDNSLGQTIPGCVPAD